MSQSIHDRQHVVRGLVELLNTQVGQFPITQRAIISSLSPEAYESWRKAFKAYPATE